MKSIVKAALVLLAVGGCVLELTACGEKPRSGVKKSKQKGPTIGKNKKNPSKSNGFKVIQVNGEPRVIRESELDGIRFELRSAYKEKLDGYKREKNAALKNNVAFNDQKPEKPKIRISRKTFETEAEADSYRARLLAKKKATKASSAPPANPPESSSSG